MAVALSIAPDGTVTEHEMPRAPRKALEFTCQVVGCQFVDVVRLSSVLDMWLDDEGLYNQPVNPLATALARSYGYVHQPYFGTVMLCSLTPGGDSVGLTSDQVRGLLTRLGDAAETI
jgi:hypothetical protein